MGCTFSTSVTASDCKFVVLLMQGSLDHFYLGLKILNQLVAEMNQVGILGLLYLYDLDSSVYLGGRVSLVMEHFILITSARFVWS